MDSKEGQLAMSTTADELANLKSMYAKGVLSLEQGGEKVSFATGTELRARIAFLERKLARETGGAATSGFNYPTFNRGFGQ